MADVSDLFEEAEPPAPVNDIYKPRWPHSEYRELIAKMHVLNNTPKHRIKLPQPSAPGIFVMQYGQFDIYVYPDTFMLRYGKDFYCKQHPYRSIKATLDGQWQLPENVQAAILAARAMLLDGNV